MVRDRSYRFTGQPDLLEDRRSLVEFKTMEEALKILGEASVDPSARESAHQFLIHVDPNVEVPQLMEALCSDNFKIRWEAARRLSEIGRPALKKMLHTLVDPKMVGNSCLRSGVYHVLHNHKDPAVRHMTAQLLQDLNGSAADLKTMYEAHRLLQELPDR